MRGGTWPMWTKLYGNSSLLVVRHAPSTDSGSQLSTILFDSENQIYDEPITGTVRGSGVLVYKDTGYLIYATRKDGLRLRCCSDINMLMDLTATKHPTISTPFGSVTLFNGLRNPKLIWNCFQYSPNSTGKSISVPFEDFSVLEDVIGGKKINPVISVSEETLSIIYKEAIFVAKYQECPRKADLIIGDDLTWTCVKRNY
eukprot:m.108922 g.108922  ORF g.108922 m.108922 type:complete len:200 (-) comp13985_c0_seq4:4328-4927(-)